MAEYQPRDFSTVAYHAYDAVWTLAFGINRYEPLKLISYNNVLKFDTHG